jgi:DNA processing protein
VRACDACLRRARLVARLAGHLDHLHANRGMLDEVFALGDEELVEALVPSRRERRRLLAGPGDGEREVASGSGLATTCVHDERYPAGLRDLKGPPAALFTAAPERFVALCAEPAVAIVGARRASAYGVEVARSLGRGLAAAGVTVVSGMALGVDSAAHGGALEAGGRTVAVLAGGADVPYPASKRALHREIARCGAVVSEMPPGFPPRRWAFPARNRTIAGLAGVTVVVEAAERSGALITARVARELGRDVAAVPGRITSPLAAGANALLRDGAHLVDGAQAVLDVLFGVGVRQAEAVRDGRELAAPLREVLAAVREGRDTVGALAGPEGDATAVVTALGALELAGYVRRVAGGAYVPLA